MPGLKKVQSEVVTCRACPRLRTHCEEIARVKKRAHMGETYWGKPIPGFGDPRARLVIVGLAPAAHGANRTGRIFTGDRSGEWLYRALHRAGFANQPESRGPGDGLELTDAYVTCVVRCAPPDNKPLPGEIARCSIHLERELEALEKERHAASGSGSPVVYLALGGIALQGLWPHLAKDLPTKAGRPPARPKFAHGTRVALGDGVVLLMSYHPSQQNTFTGRLTQPMFDSVFNQAKRELGRL